MDLSPTITEALLPVVQPLIFTQKKKYGGKQWKSGQGSFHVHSIRGWYAVYFSKLYSPFEPYCTVTEEGKLVHPVAQYTELIW
jgi:hypothetical protein